jgi:hypothetical protein
MAEYDCNLVPLNKMIYGKDGMILPLCNSCKAKDCTNPIQFTEISLLGIKIKCKAFVRFSNFYAVTKCTGYLPDVDEDDNLEEENINDEENNTD